MWNEHGETSCSAKLLYDGLEVQPDQSLGDLYNGFEKYAVSGLPMPLPDKPIITAMSDTKATLTWKPGTRLNRISKEISQGLSNGFSTVFYRGIFKRFESQDSQGNSSKTILRTVRRFY